jgi:hypothetical protein
MEALPHIALALGVISILCLMASPAIGMVAVFIAKPFVDALWDIPFLFGFRPTEVFSALIPLLLMVHMALARDDKSLMRMPMKGMWLTFSIYILLFSMVIAYNDELKTGANIFFRYINGIVGFYFLQAFFRQGDRFKWFLLALILGGLFPMSLGFYQALTGVQWRPEQAEGIARNIGIWHDGVNMRTYAQQTIFGLLLYSALYVKAWNIPLKVVTLSYLAISTVVMVKVYSKAAFLTFGLWVLCWTILRRQFAVIGVIGIVGLLVTTYFAGDLADKIATLFHKEAGFFSGEVDGKMTFHGRWFGWIEMMEKWERLPALSQMFGSGEVATGAHNDFLQMLFHGGLVGLAIYLSLLIVVGIRIGRNLLAKTDELAVAALMVYLMWMIDAVGLVPSAYPAEQWLIWGTIGLSFRTRADEALAHPAREAIQEIFLPAGLTSGPASAAAAAQRRFPLLSDRGGS